MWKTIINEWRFLYRSKIFFGLTIGFALIFILSIFLSRKQYQTQNELYVTAKSELRDQWENIDSMNPHGAAHYGTYVFKPSNILSNLDEGVNSVTGNVLRVEGHVQNEMVHSEASQMMSASRFGKFKVSMLLQYIIPLLLIFLAFNTISSERQRGRIKLLLLQGAHPQKLFLSKTIATWSYGMLLLLMILLVYSVFNLPDLNTDTISRLLLFSLSYALYYFILVGLTVVLTVRMKSVMIALTSALGIWILWTIFLPSITLSKIEDWHPLPSRNEFSLAMREDRSKGIDGHNPSDERGKALEDEILAKYDVDSLSQLPINFDGIRMQADEEYGNIVWDKHFGNLEQVLNKQKQSTQYFGLLSPMISLRNLSMGYAGNDNLHYHQFLRQVEDYRRVFIKELNDEHAYGGSKTGDWGWKAKNDFYKSIKDFDHQQTSLTSVWQHYALDNMILILWTLLTLGLIVLGTKRIDIE